MVVVMAVIIVIMSAIIVIMSAIIVIMPIVVVVTVLVMIVPVVAANVIRFVFCGSNEIDGPIAGMIFVTVLAPISGVVRRYMQVDGGQ
jgi:hypothetical protein